MERLKNAKHLRGETVAEIKWILQNTPYTSIKVIADEYDCSPTMISRIRDGKSWDRIAPIKPKHYED